MNINFSNLINLSEANKLIINAVRTGAIVTSGFDLSNLIKQVSNGSDNFFKKEHFPPLRGEHCKLSALALIDAWYADKHRQDNIPLLSLGNHCNSVRKIAKKYNSKQGEVLQLNDLIKIANEMGYQTQIFYPKNQDEFVQILKNHANEGKPLITFYSVNQFTADIDTGETPSEMVEHATVITNFNNEKQTVTLNHWGKAFS